MKNNHPVSLFTWFIILLLSGFGLAQDPNRVNEKSLDYKIGQMIIVGFRGTGVTTGDDIYNLIKNYHIGGVYLADVDLPSEKSMNRNILSQAQLKNLTSQLQKISPTRLLIAIDAEGGLITRLKPEKGFQSHKSPQEIGDLNLPDSTAKWASRIADELAALGINLNFAPVVDLNINPECPVIGKKMRSFSQSIAIVTANSKIFIEEHAKRNIICVPKHFPGHGSAQNDSHKGLTDVTATWSRSELVPYRELIRENYCDIIMTAHVFNAQLDTLPSTLSRKIITNILRDELNFTKVIISDDLQMKAISNFYTFEETIEKAIYAGIDILLMTNNHTWIPYDAAIAIKAINHIKELIKKGAISEERINQSYVRIKKLKEKL